MVRPEGGVVIFMFIVLVLLLLSALISSAESAFFSLSPQETNQIKQENSSTSKLIIDLLNMPNELLATILITNNFLNVGIVILSSFIINYFSCILSRKILINYTYYFIPVSPPDQSMSSLSMYIIYYSSCKNDCFSVHKLNR